jgi:hypothetical protein
MALLPSGIIVGATGNNTSPVEKRDGGTLIGITSASNTTTGPITRLFNVLNNAIEGQQERRSLVLEKTGAGSAYNTKKALTSGTFARDQVATRDEWIIRGVAAKINGSANTAILINGILYNRPKTMTSNKSKGAKTSTAYRSGYWRPTGISGQRTNWSTAPATNNVSYVSTTNNAVDASDQCQFVTYMAVPGELVYMYGSLDAKLKDYPAR